MSRFEILSEVALSGRLGEVPESWLFAESDLPVSVQKVVSRLRKELNPRAIFLYGSRARETASPTSDFDIATLGVEDGFAWTEFRNYVTYDAPTLFQIDLFRYEGSSGAFQEGIEEDGRLVVESLLSKD